MLKYTTNPKINIKNNKNNNLFPPSYEDLMPCWDNIQPIFTFIHFCPSYNCNRELDVMSVKERAEYCDCDENDTINPLKNKNN
jgi:hypothetical protein